jgi:two-component system chemotaxis sensor kinase CheA
VQEIVVKPLGRSLAHLTVFSGNTILGDGSVVLILNPNGLAGHIGLDVANRYRGASDEGPRAMPQSQMRLTVFRAGAGALKALPLSLVSRIETIGRQDIHEVDGVKVVYHLGRLMPVIDLGCGDDETLQKLHVLVVGVGGEPMGLLVSDIVDIVESAIEIEMAGATESIVGSTTIGGEPVEILDLPYFMRLARPAAFSRGHARRFNVLLVDDKPFFRDMLSPVLGAAGYAVATAGSGHEALALFQKGYPFDALITDIDMPGMSGYALAQRLREDPRRGDMPIIALDAHAGANVVDAARAAGMMGVVGKFDRAALLDTLGRALQPVAFGDQSLERAMMSEAA